MLMCLMLPISCNRALTEDVENETALQTIYASVASTPQTKNTIDDGTLKVTWTSGDAINVFFGANSNNKFVTEDSGEVAKFKGSVDVITGGGEGLDDNTSLWGVYPYSLDNSCDGNTVTLTVPNEQDAAENTFAKDIFPIVARSQNFYTSIPQTVQSF